jgi:hypothetical protein
MLDFTGLTDEQIAELLNTEVNSIAKLTKQQAMELLNKPPVIDLLSTNVAEEYKKKLEGMGEEEISELANPLELINSLGNDILKQKIDVQSLISPNGALDVVNKMSSIDFEGITTNLSEIMQTAQLTELVDSIGNGTFGPLLGKFDLLDALPMDTINNLSLPDAITSGAYGPIGQLVGQLQQTADDFLSSEGLGQFSKLLDVGFGFDDAIGGKNNDGNFKKLVKSFANVNPDSDNPNEDAYSRLESSISSAASKDWASQGSPANPLHAEAFGLSGRSNDSDGNEGILNWNTPFVNYVLKYAGLSYIETISASAYSSYGNSVNFNMLGDIRKNDIAIFKSSAPVGIIGFVRKIDPGANTVTILAGNINGGVNETTISLSRSSRVGMRFLSLRRNWKVPADADVPLFTSDQTTWFTGAPASNNRKEISLIRATDTELTTPQNKTSPQGQTFNRTGLIRTTGL